MRKWWTPLARQPAPLQRWLTLSPLLAITLALAGCGAGGSAGEATGFEAAATADSVEVYLPDSPWADVLERCVFVDSVEGACTLAQLPFISTDGSTPTKQAIMERLLVSHDWMGKRFGEVLDAASPDLLRMFGSTTAILIGSEVRPSFYYALNAAIQLDPVVLWQTLEEKRTISTAEDFRTDFGRELRFVFLQRAVIDGEPAVPFFSLDDDSERSFDDIEIAVMQLLYHELTHAIDAMPLQQIAGLDPQRKALEAIVGVEDVSLSRQIIIRSPLASEPLKELADVRFRGARATEVQRQFGAVDVGAFIADEGAMKFYSYLSVREDVATLVESALMKLHYDVTLNTAFVDKPADPDSDDCGEYLVSWGVRNRLADPLVADRARLLLELGLGESVNVAQLFGASLGGVEAMEQGVDWCTNNARPVTLANRRATSDRRQLRADLQGADTGHRTDVGQGEPVR